MAHCAFGIDPYLRQVAPMARSATMLSAPEARKIFPPRYNMVAAAWSGSQVTASLQSSSRKPPSSTMRAAITDAATATDEAPRAASDGG
jgi:hypothetical protein